MKRAHVLRGFCISVGVDAEVGTDVDLPDALYREMLSREAIEPAAPVAEAGEPKPDPKQTKDAVKR